MPSIEPWFAYAILSGIFAGLYAFFTKISAQKNHKGPLVTGYAMLSAAIFSLFLYILTEGSVHAWQLLALIAVANGIAYALTIIARIESLRNIHSVIYFPLSKVLGILIVLAFSFFAFSESLSFQEGIGILLGMLVPLLLIQKNEHLRQINLTKGLILLAVSMFFGASSSALSKIITLNDINPYLYITATFIIGGIFSLVVASRKNDSVAYSSHRLKRTGIIGGILLFFSTYFLTNLPEVTWESSIL